MMASRINQFLHYLQVNIGFEDYQTRSNGNALKFTGTPNRGLILPIERYYCFRKTAGITVLEVITEEINDPNKH